MSSAHLATYSTLPPAFSIPQRFNLLIVTVFPFSLPQCRLIEGRNPTIKTVAGKQQVPKKHLLNLLNRFINSQSIFVFTLSRYPSINKNSSFVPFGLF